MSLQLMKQLSIDKHGNKIDIWYEDYEEGEEYLFYFSDEGKYIQQVIDSGYLNDTTNGFINNIISFFDATRDGNKITFPKTNKKSFDDKLLRMIQIITIVSIIVANGNIN